VKEERLRAKPRGREGGSKAVDWEWSEVEGRGSPPLPCPSLRGLSCVRGGFVAGCVASALAAGLAVAGASVDGDVKHLVPVLLFLG